MLIAIDHGNHAIKTVHQSFVSGLARHSVRPPMADEVIEYNGEYWTLSGQRLAYRRDKPEMKAFSSSRCLPLPESWPIPAVFPPLRRSIWLWGCPRNTSEF